MSESALAIELTDSQRTAWAKYSDGYVSIWGRYRAGPAGHFHSSSGSIVEVLRLSRALSRKQMDKLRSEALEAID